MAEQDEMATDFSCGVHYVNSWFHPMMKLDKYGEKFYNL